MLNRFAEVEVEPQVADYRLGLVLMLASLGDAAFGLVAKVLQHTAPGWTSLMLAILIMGAIELTVLSIHSGERNDRCEFRWTWLLRCSLFDIMGVLATTST